MTQPRSNYFFMPHLPILWQKLYFDLVYTFLHEIKLDNPANRKMYFKHLLCQARLLSKATIYKDKIRKTTARNPVKLEIRSFVMNFNSRGFSLRVLYCVMDTGYGHGRPAMHSWKVESTNWLKHKLRAMIGG